MLPNDVKDASRLIEWGLHPRALPEAHPEYRDLVRRWMDDGAFKMIVASVAEGLKLRVVGVSARTGIVLGTDTESVFAYTISRFRRNVSDVDAAVVALVLVATCATFYPAQDSLDSDEIMSPSATLSEIRDRLTKLCQALESQDRSGMQRLPAGARAGNIFGRFPRLLRMQGARRAATCMAWSALCLTICWRRDSWLSMNARTGIVCMSPHRVFA
jgi:hypothetical protein